MTPPGVNSRRFITKSTTPPPQESRAGSSLAAAFSTASTTLSCRPRVYSTVRSASPAPAASLAGARRPTVGPEWVCEEFSRTCSRLRPVFFSIRSQIGSATDAGNPSRSLVTITPRCPSRSSRTIALAYRSVATPSESLLRLA